MPSMLHMHLAALIAAKTVDDMDIPGFCLRALKGEMLGRWAIIVSVNGPLIFEFRDDNGHVLDCEDYRVLACILVPMLITEVYLEPCGGRELAGKLDVAPSTLSRLLKSSSRVTSKLALRLSKAIGAQLRELAGPAGRT